MIKKFITKIKSSKTKDSKTNTKTIHKNKTIYSIREKNIETSRGEKEEIKEKSNFYGRYRRGNRQQFSYEENNLSKNRYDDKTKKRITV